LVLAWEVIFICLMPGSSKAVFVLPVDIMTYIRTLPRPMIFHFLSSIDVARVDNRVSMAHVYDNPANDDK
jgi:hypothetical protein